MATDGDDDGDDDDYDEYFYSTATTSLQLPTPTCRGTIPHATLIGHLTVNPMPNCEDGA